MLYDLTSIYDAHARVLATNIERRTWREAWAAGSTIERLERALHRARTVLQLQPAR